MCVTHAWANAKRSVLTRDRFARSSQCHQSEMITMTFRSSRASSRRSGRSAAPPPKTRARRSYIDLLSQHSATRATLQCTRISSAFLSLMGNLQHDLEVSVDASYLSSYCNPLPGSCRYRFAYVHASVYVVVAPVQASLATTRRR